MERNRQVTHVPLGTSRNFPSGSFLSQGYIWTLHSAHHYLNWGLWVWHSQSFLDCDIRCRYICQELHLPLVGGESRSLLMKSREIEVDTKKGKETRERERILTELESLVVLSSLMSSYIFIIEFSLRCTFIFIMYSPFGLSWFTLDLMATRILN